MTRSEVNIGSVLTVALAVCCCCGRHAVSVRSLYNCRIVQSRWKGVGERDRNRNKRMTTEWNYRRSTR